MKGSGTTIWLDSTFQFLDEGVDLLPFSTRLVGRKELALSAFSNGARWSMTFYRLSLRNHSWRGS
jgi:hypothetical protein